MIPYTYVRTPRWHETDAAQIIFTVSFVDYAMEALEGWFRDVFCLDWYRMNTELDMGNAVRPDRDGYREPTHPERRAPDAGSGRAGRTIFHDLSGRWPEERGTRTVSSPGSYVRWCVSPRCDPWRSPQTCGPGWKPIWRGVQNAHPNTAGFAIRMREGSGTTILDRGAAQYMLQIAHRIRAERDRLGMTRKRLAQHSHISERYLSQVESGRANISVALLWRVAHAMDVEVRTLLPAAGGSERGGGGSGIALVGLRGAGKSTLGNALAQRVDLPFVDLVDVIARRAGMEVGELFSLGGQEAYRRFEREALDEVLSGGSEVVLETGGSLVTHGAIYEKTSRPLLHHLDQSDAQRAHEPGSGPGRPASGAGEQ